MIYFFYGEDTYSIKQKVDSILSDFVKAEGIDLNISRLDGANLSKSEFLSFATVLPFLGNLRLIIIKNLLSENNLETKKEIASVLNQIPKTTELIFVETSSPDKRESAFKSLVKIAQAKEFTAPSELAIKQTILKKTSEQGMKISDRTAQKLSLAVGGDYWRINNELDKLILYKKALFRDEIDEADIEKMVESNFNLVIFSLTDAIAEKNLKSAISLLESFMKAGEDPFKIFNLIIGQVRNMLLISDFGLNSPSNVIAKELGIHPYIVQKTIPALRKFNFDALNKIHEKLQTIDYKIKSGLLDIQTALTLLMIELCR